MKEESATFEENVDGIWLDLPARQYRRAPGASVSPLKHLDPPARFPVETKKHEPPTPWMRMGTLVHQAFLEPDVPLPRIVVRPDTYPAPATHADVRKGVIKEGDPLKWSANAKYCKAWLAAQEEAENEVMTSEEFETFGNVVNALADDEVTAAIFSEGYGEVSWFASLTLPGSGRMLRRKGRLDWISPRRKFIADVKVVQKEQARREFWEATAWDRRYYVQAAYYMDGWNDLCDDENMVDRFIFVVVEREAPYLISKFEMPIDSALARAGRAQYLQDLETLSECRATGVWPGYLPGIQPMDMPAFARKKLRI